MVKGGYQVKGNYNQKARHRNTPPPPPSRPADPIIHSLTIMALMSQPNIDRQLDQVLNVIDTITNTMRSIRMGVNSFHSSIQEAQTYLFGMPSDQGQHHAPHNPYQQQQHPFGFNQGNQYKSSYENFTTKPANESE